MKVIGFSEYWHSLGYSDNDLKGLSNLQIGHLADAFGKRLDQCKDCIHYTGRNYTITDEKVFCNGGDCKLAQQADN